MEMVVCKLEMKPDYQIWQRKIENRIIKIKLRVKTLNPEWRIKDQGIEQLSLSLVQD